MYEPAPPISPALLEWLDRVFGDELPMTENPVDYYRAQGRKQIITKLRIELERQDNER